MSKGFTHEPPNSQNKEWYTPPEIFEMLGCEFDLDPASPDISKVSWIPALVRYTENGLLKDWFGRVWLNPPYGKETGDWLDRLALHGNGIALVFARTDTIWFHSIAAKADVICFMQGRIKFINSKGYRATNTSGCGSMLLAWGKECARILVNSNIGLCLKK